MMSPAPEGSAGPVPGWTRGATELRWGLKRSFLDYVSGMPDFVHSMGRGVRALPQEQLFAFPAAGAGGADAGSGIIRFEGELRFVAHFGMLRVEIADPWVELTADGAHLSVTDLDETGPERGRFRLVDLTPAGVAGEGEWVARQYQALLAADAVGIFGGVYPTGEPFEVLTVVSRSIDEQG